MDTYSTFTDNIHYNFLNADNRHIYFAVHNNVINLIKVIC